MGCRRRAGKPFPPRRRDAIGNRRDAQALGTVPQREGLRDVVEPESRGPGKAEERTLVGEERRPQRA